MSRPGNGAKGPVRAVGLVLAGLLATPPASTGAAGPGPWKNAPEAFLLANGVRCVYQRDEASLTTVVGLFIGGGRAAVPAGQDGLAAMSARLLLELPDEGKVQDLMSQATRLSHACLEDGSFVLVECLSANLEAALKVAGRIVLDPLISGLRVGRARELMKANGKAEDDDAVAAGRQAVFRGLFGDGGYGTSTFGSSSSLAGIDRREVLAFVRRSVVRGNVTFYVQSDLDRETVGRRLETSFKSFPDGEPLVPALREPGRPEGRDIVLERDTRQVYIGRAFVLPRAGIQDMARGVLLQTLLGQGPGSRLWGLREDERLAYGVDAELTWTRAAGVLIARLETGREKSGRAAPALDRVLASLREDGAATMELEAAKNLALARFLRETEAKAPRLRLLGTYGALGLGPEAVPELLEAVGRATRDDLNAFIRRVLDPERALRVTVGPPPSPLGP